MTNRRGEARTSVRNLAAVDRQRQALELRMAGVTYEDIARRLGYAGTSGAVKAVSTALKRTLQEPADGVRELEVKRLDKMLLGVWPAATHGDIQAIDRVLKIMRRRADLLGLDAPIKHEDTVTLLVHDFAQKAAVEAGLDPQLVIAEAERILHAGNA